MKRETVKSIASFIGSFCVGGVVSLGVKQHIIPKNVGEKIMIAVGSFVISDMISDKASEYIEGKIDEVCDTFDKNKLEWEKSKGYLSTDEDKKEEGDEE